MALIHFFQLFYSCLHFYLSDRGGVTYTSLQDSISCQKFAIVILYKTSVFGSSWLSSEKKLMFINLYGNNIKKHQGNPNQSFSWKGKVDGSASKPALRQNTGYMVEKTCHYIAPYLGAFWGLLNASVIQIWFKTCFHIQKRSLECGGQLTLSSIWSKKH